MTLREFIDILPKPQLLDISVNDPQEGGLCFGATVEELRNKYCLRRYLDFEVTYAASEVIEYSYACVDKKQRTCILVDLELLDTVNDLSQESLLNQEEDQIACQAKCEPIGPEDYLE